MTDSIPGEGTDTWPEQQKNAFDAIDASVAAQTNQKLLDMGHINWEEKYRPIYNEIANRPTDQAPSPLQAAFATLGAPRDAPRILSQKVETAAEQKRSKLADMLRVHEQLMTAQANQEAADGDFKKAAITHGEALKTNVILEHMSKTEGLQNDLKKLQVEHDNRTEEITQRGLIRDRQILEQFGDADKKAMRLPDRTRMRYRAEVDAIKIRHSQDVTPVDGIEKTELQKDQAYIEMKKRLDAVDERFFGPGAETTTGADSTGTATETPPPLPTTAAPTGGLGKGSPMPTPEQFTDPLLYNISLKSWKRNNGKE
jgi:hypothetical protein